MGEFRWIITLAVSLAALLSLALIPWFLERQHADLEKTIQDLSSARILTSELALAHSSQMMRVQQYVASGDTDFLELYSEDFKKSESRLNELDEIISNTPFSSSYLIELEKLEELIREWQVLHAPLMDDRGIVIRVQDFEERIEDDRSRYETIRSETRAFENLLIRDAASATIKSARHAIIQIWVTVGTIFLAIMGTWYIGISIYKIRDMLRNESHRRQEEVFARREFRAMLRGTGDGLVGIDIDGRCTFLNESGAELLGYKSKELKGRIVHQMIHHTRPDGTNYPKEECPVYKSLATEQTIKALDEFIWRKDGSYFPAQVTVSPMKDGLGIIGVVLTITDMTQIRDSEKALREAVQARDEVLAVVSHDLRNPVGTIAAAAELLADKPLSSKRWNEHLGLIQRSAHRINRLIHDLLEVANIEKGQLAVYMKPVDTNYMLEEAIVSARARAEEESVSLYKEIDPDLPSVKADLDRMLQVMSNLIVNALKFTPEGGKVIVSATVVEKGVLISIKDTGPGIDPDVSEHLFDRYWKGRHSLGEGSGLGLTIVEGILAAHGSQIEVETEIGKGSTFSFVLTCS
tara:strand:+ start:6050 stop:7783 length:1734 start_codon:yes stop_codon:yes gene_type:complete